MSLLQQTHQRQTENHLTLADKVLVQLQNSIIKGEVTAGSKINEQAIAKQFGISRGPAREALHTLERQLLIIRAPHVGARIARLTVNELNELYALRSTLESMACELAAIHISTQQLQQLATLIQYQQKALQNDDFDFQQQGDIDFHYQIIRASGNQHLQRTLIDGLYHLLRMYRYQCSSGIKPTQAIAEHQQIYTAIANADGELAGLLMRRHIERGRKKAAQRLQQMEPFTSAQL